VKLADGALDVVVALGYGLEQHAIFAAALDLALPGVDAVDLGDLRAGGEPAFDQRIRHALRFLPVADGGDDGDRGHAIILLLSKSSLSVFWTASLRLALSMGEPEARGPEEGDPRRSKNIRAVPSR
jgi:hypothetical protein